MLIFFVKLCENSGIFNMAQQRAGYEPNFVFLPAAAYLFFKASLRKR